MDDTENNLPSNVRILPTPKVVPAVSAEVVALLEHVLALAKQGNVVGVAVVMQHTQSRTGTAFTSPDHPALLGGLAILSNRIVNSLG